jgi:hypothetical protein
MGLCPSSIDGSSCLGVCIPIPWLRLCPLFFESLLGKYVVFEFRFLLLTLFVSADHYCRIRLPKLAGATVRFDLFSKRRV